MNIKPTSLTITQLLGAENEQYVIPAYQRRYSWREKQLWELIDDISLLEPSDTHLLGSIVCLTDKHTAGINKLELVDGQQRLTTVCILLHCIRDRLKQEKKESQVSDVERLLHAKSPDEALFRKVALDSIDAAEFEQLVAKHTPAHADNPNLAFAFSTFRDWVSQKELAELITFLYALKNQAIVIRLDVSEAKDAFKLFETINNRGLKLSPTDIVKNFILGNAARFGEDKLAFARLRWAELIRNLDGTNLDVFFRQYLIARMTKRVTASYVIPYFKTLFMRTVAEAAQLPERHWYSDEKETEEDDDDNVTTSNGEPAVIERSAAQVSFTEFLDDLIKCAKDYGQVSLAKTGVPQIDRRLRNLRMIKSLQTYGFLMHLRAGGCSDSDFETILGLTEAFMLRRHICRERANDNETAFARLCAVDCKNPIKEVTEEFRRYCPSDARFREAFAKSAFNANLMERARYCLEQFEYKRQGKYLELLVGGADAVHVEHIIPQTIKTRKAKKEFGDWPDYLGPDSEALHPDYVSRIGNLTLFAGALNIGASNNPYERKKVAYSISAIKLTNSLPQEYAEFKFEQVDDRAAELADLAVKLWPVP
ncbi:MAG: DUF262 domain-containing protein [Pirellulales bacterium]